MVAERARVGPGLVHYHFESVQALLSQAVLGVMGKALSQLRAVLATSASADDGLRQMLAALDDYSGTDATSLLFVEAHLASTRDARLRTHLSRLLEDFRDFLASWLAARGTRAPAETAAVLAAAVDGVMLHRALHPGMTSTVVTPVLCRLLDSADQDTGAGRSERG